MKSMNPKYILSTVLVLAVLSMIGLGAPAQAAVVTLEFRNNGAQGAVFDFDANTGTYNSEFVSLFFESYVGGVPGDAGDQLNATTSGFGINESNSGDDTDGLDTANGQEAIRITFTPIIPAFITLNSIDIKEFGGSDAGTFSIIGGSSFALSSGILPVNENVTGLTIEVLSTGGSFSFDGLTFDAAPIPEPSSMVLLGCGLGVACYWRRRNRQVVD